MVVFKCKANVLLNIRLFILLAVIVIVNINATLISEDTDPNVKIEVYYESLCPDSKRFFTYQLLGVSQNLHDIINVTLFPYGKANRTQTEEGNWNFTCQHGPKECEGNMIQSCVIDIWDNNETAMNFVFCVMAPNEDPNITETCADKLKLDYNEIKNCANGNRGIELMNYMANKTEALKNLDYIPRILINYVYSKDQNDKAQEDLAKLVCSMYKGKEPKECQTTTTTTTHYSTTPNNSIQEHFVLAFIFFLLMIILTFN